jgi:hypothetical protein
MQKTRAGGGCSAAGDKKGEVVWMSLPDWAFLEQPCHHERDTAASSDGHKGAESVQTVCFELELQTSEIDSNRGSKNIIDHLVFGFRREGHFLYDTLPDSLG